MDFNYKCQEYIAMMPALKPREMVEVRFYGDRNWYTARITKSFASGLSDVRLEDGSQEHQIERHMIRKSTTSDNLNSMFVDPGMYERGDLVEIKLAGVPWQPGQIMSINNDGTYNVLYESSMEESNVAGRWIRHNFQNDQLVEVRSNGQNFYKPAMIQNQDNNGMFSVRYLDGQMESNINPRRMFPSNRRKVYINALVHAMEMLGMVMGTGSSMVHRSGSGVFSTYSVGDKVECNVRDLTYWHPARIMRMSGNNTYDIEYLDGTTEYGVSSSNLRMATPSPNGKGGRGAARYRSPRRQVVFADQVVSSGSNGRSDTMPSQNMDQATAGTSSIAKAMASVAISNQEPRSNEGAKSFGYSHGDMFYRSYQEGMRVEARFHGEGAYCPGFISRVNQDGTYDVSFDYNEVFPSLPPDVIRPFSVGEQHFYGDMHTMNSMNGMNAFQHPSAFIEPYFFNGYGGAHSNFRMNSNEFRGQKFGMGMGAEGRFESPFGAGQKNPPVLRKGLKVEIQTGGRWVTGRIVKVYPQGAYDINLDDGSMESNIPRQNIRTQNNPGRFGEDSGGFGGAFLYRPDMMVEARLRGSSKYYPGFIHGCHPDGTYDVCFEDGSTETGLKQHMLRPYGYLEMMARETMGDGPFSKPGQFSSNGMSKVGYEFCSGYFGSQVSDGYGYDSMKRNSEREFRGHPNFNSSFATETSFGVYHPREVYDDKWNPMLTYIYDAFQEYMYRYQFGSKNPGMYSRRGLNKDTQQLMCPGFLPFGVELTIVPCSEWCDFSGGEPCMGRVVWNGWRVSCPFFFRPRQGAPRNFTIKVYFFVRAVVVGEVAMDVMYPSGSDTEATRNRGQGGGYSSGRDLRYMDVGSEPGRGTRERFNSSGAVGSGVYVDVRASMFRNIFMVQMENDEGYEMLMAETVEAVPGLMIRRRDSSAMTPPMLVRTADRVQFACSRDGGQMSSDMNADFRGVQLILVTPEERAHKMLLTFSDLPMVFPQSMDRLPGCNFSFLPEVNIYRWQYQANGRPLMFLRKRLYEAARMISKCYFETFERPVPMGMLLLPVGEDFFSFNGFEAYAGTNRDRLEGSMWNLFFMCEDHASQTMRDEFAHQPIEMRFDPKFMVEAYPLLKATVAILMYCRMTFKDNIACFPTPFNIYGLSRRFDESMLVEMSNFYDEQFMRWSSGFGVGMGRGDFDMEYGNANYPRNNYGDYDYNSQYNMGFGRTQYPNQNQHFRGDENMYPPATPFVSKSFTNMDQQSPFVAQLFPSVSAPTLSYPMNPVGMMGSGEQRPSIGNTGNYPRLSPGADFLVNAVECAEAAVATIQNWALWRAARKVRARLDDLAPTWLQQCDMRPMELDLKVWWVSPFAYKERWEPMHWMVKGPDAPSYVSPGPGGLGALQVPSPTCGFSTASGLNSPMTDIANHLTGEVGIKDFSAANEIAMLLSKEGFENWDDVLRMDMFVGSGNNFEDVKWFMCDLGIPMIYAMRIMNIIRSNRNIAGMF